MAGYDSIPSENKPKNSDILRLTNSNKLKISTPNKSLATIMKVTVVLGE